ncbi:hypothetical protein BBS_4 [Burkholderia pseudomallei NAU20B-16]|nr:hypothetical protein BBS_4 [Burkholderia pseudomallei NAU20B-16]
MTASVLVAESLPGATFVSVTGVVLAPGPPAPTSVTVFVGADPGAFGVVTPGPDVYCSGARACSASIAPPTEFCVVP